MGFASFQNFRDYDDHVAEVAENIVEHREEEKRRSAQVSQKGHKRKVFHKPPKDVKEGSSLLGKLLDPVVDPRRKQREAEFLKNPFRGLDRYSR